MEKQRLVEAHAEAKRSCGMAEESLSKGNILEFIMAKCQMVEYVRSINDRQQQYLGTSFDEDCFRYYNGLLQSENKGSEIATEQNQQYKELLSRHIQSYGRIVVPSASALHSTFYKPKKHVSGQVRCLIVFVKDSNGERKKTGGDLIEVNVEPVAGNVVSEKRTQVSVRDERDGSYVACWEWPEKGEHRVGVFLNGQELSGSPFVWSLERGRDYKQVHLPQLVFGSDGLVDGVFQINPCDVTVNNKKGRIIVTDTCRGRVLKFTSNGRFVHAFGSKGTSNGQFDYPCGVAVDDNGDHIIVADRGNHHIQVFTSNGRFMHAFGSKGTSNGQFQDPYGVAVCWITWPKGRGPMKRCVNKLISATN